jgi:hypothetical protein
VASSVTYVLATFPPRPSPIGWERVVRAKRDRVRGPVWRLT